MKGLFLIHDELDAEFKIINFANRELLAKYLKNNPSLSNSEYIIIEGELQHIKDRHLYDGRFQ